MAKKKGENKEAKGNGGETKETKKVERNSFNHKVGSQAQRLDDLLLKGGLKVEELAKKVDSKVSRVRSHIYHLTGKGYTVNSVKDEEKKSMTYQLAAN